MRTAIAILAFGACSFSAPPPMDNTIDAPSIGSEAAIDAGFDAPPIMCGELTCDPNATCLEMPARCECKQGFAGDGFTCADVDECATANGGCPAACVNTSGSRVCHAAASCEEMQAVIPAFRGSTTLYAGNDADRPWPAFCDDDRDYLELAAGSDNFSQYTTNRSGQTSVRTTFTRIRIDPETFVVDIADQTYSSSTGQLLHDGTTTVTSMPYAVAMDCAGNNRNTGVGNIDLTGTPFVVMDTFQTRGSMPNSTMMPGNGGRTVALTAGGNCGWIAPDPAPYNPFNQLPSTPILSLSYDAP